MVHKEGTPTTATHPDRGCDVRDPGEEQKRPIAPSANEIGTKGSMWAVDDLRDLVSPVRPVYPGHETFLADAPWIRIDSRLLGEEIVLVLHRDRVWDAEEAFPGAVIYVVPEMEILRGYADRPETVRRLHGIKKEMHGWLVRPKGMAG